jgi:AmmeMemoRadiSam system protein B/AmmeMemoRadiSam system protein A
MRISKAIFIGLILGSIICRVSSLGAVREPAVAGQFYPSDPIELKKMVAGHLGAVKDLPQIDGQIIGLIVPHAGLIYSGPIAAYSYKLLENSRVDKVVLCGCSHKYRFSGLSVFGSGIQWKNSLGTVLCDDGLCNYLIGYDKSFGLFPEAQTKEHCLEVQLPYLQTVLKDFKIIPIVMGEPTPGTIDVLARALASIPSSPGTILVASTDWQHYRPASIGGKMDSVGMECLRNFDIEGLEKNLQNGKTEMCSDGAVLAVMKAAKARGANRVKILKYGDSGDTSKDKSQVVGYVAAVLYKSNEPVGEKETETKKKVSGASSDEDLAKRFDLNEDNKRILLEIARESIKSHLTGKPLPEFEIPDALNEFGAAFVTLNENNQLRGCIGHTTAVEPLYKTISICAVQAAVGDPRFPPVTPDEIGKLRIEISVLTPMKKIESIDEVKVGRDGLMIFKGSRRGLLLPQVATEYGWNATQFLEQTCLKAGLNINDYKLPDAVIYRFQAVIFGE